MADKTNKEYTKAQLVKLLKSNEATCNNGPTIGKRHMQIVLAFLIVFLNYAIRISMSVIIVAMTDPTANENKDIPTYNWNDKSLVVSSFMWGYVIPQVGAGYLATTYGAKWFLAGSLIASSSLGLLVPIAAATFGSKGLIGIRMLQGLSQGVLFPSIHVFLSRWVPINERSRLGTLPYVGAPVGTVGSMLLTGLIASSWYGWPMAVYFFSGLGLSVGLVFAYFGCSEPSIHSTITEEEKNYIINNLSGTESTIEKEETAPVPWIEILTSLPFWALLLAQIGWSWSNWTLLLETPIYMNHVMKFDLKSNSVLSSLSYIAEAISAICYSIVADFLIKRKICDIGRTRKLMNGIGLIFPSIALVVLANCKSTDGYIAVAMLVFIGLTGSSTRSGFNINQIDLSPNYAGILMGICNGTSAAVSSLGPLIIQLLVKDENDPKQWQQIFYIAALIAVLFFIFNVVFGSGSVQPWNNGSKKYREKYSTKAAEA
ncbi:putative inorganic phosphate cotransporter [Diabrotica undecimpunctata]|uniref:putative inorganic phosphate cotransporter n=1 Tax=Diabrotica undecimpunctata TaxID=50387 RepID=UPI003B63C8D7